MEERGMVTVYFRYQYMDIHGVLHRCTKNILVESGKTMQQARGLYLDIRGMNKLIAENIYYKWDKE